MAEGFEQEITTLYGAREQDRRVGPYALSLDSRFSKSLATLFS
jgi:hypothetical protein